MNRDVRIPERDNAGQAHVIAFGIVGACAFAVHFAVVAALVPTGLNPLAANIAGFLTAFGLSFAGHSRWSFPAGERSRPRALGRFFAVALTGFVANETLYAALLGFTPLDYRAALVIVLGLVAGSTFIASRYWAFAYVTS